MCVDSRRPAMNLWQQNYDPAGNIWLSSLIASLPILFFFFALIKLKLKGYVAASWTVAIALAVALLFYKMPVANALATVVEGKVSLIAGVSKDVTDRVKAGELIGMVAQQVGGKGGGRPDMAQAGGTDAAALPAALASVKGWVSAKLQ
eukprot:781616_1